MKLIIAFAVALFWLNLRVSTMEKVDFANLTYPEFAGLHSVPLKNGAFCSPPDRDVCVDLGGPRFGDMTGDGLPEAAVSLHAVFRSGNGSHSTGLLYTMRDGRPTLIGKFAGGDRANGGIVDYQIRNEQLIVERLQGSCAICDDAIETDTFKWIDGRLRLVSSAIAKRPS